VHQLAAGLSVFNCTLGLRTLPRSLRARLRVQKSRVRTSSVAMASLPVRCVACTGPLRRRNTFWWRLQRRGGVEVAGLDGNARVRRWEVTGMKSKDNKVRIGTKTNTRDPISMKGREWDYSNDDRLENGKGGTEKSRVKGSEMRRKNRQIAGVTKSSKMA
jgi:hypothetical protein